MKENTMRSVRPLPARASGRLAEAQQENTEATDADLLRKANPFLAKLVATHLAGDKAAQGIAGRVVLLSAAKGLQHGRRRWQPGPPRPRRPPWEDVNAARVAWAASCQKSGVGMQARCC